MVALLVAASATLLYLRLWASTTSTAREGERESYADSDDDDDDERDGEEGGPPTMDRMAIEQMVVDLHGRRHEMVASARGKGAPEMADTLAHICALDVSEQSAEMRMICAELIQDYLTTDSTLAKDKVVAHVALAKEWLDFPAIDSGTRVAQMTLRLALCLTTRSMPEMAHVFTWLTSGLSDKDVSDVYPHWVLRCFQCSCLLGFWDDAIKYGRALESISSELMAPDDVSASAPAVHPLHVCLSA